MSVAAALALVISATAAPAVVDPATVSASGDVAGTPPAEATSPVAPTPAPTSPPPPESGPAAAPPPANSETKSPAAGGEIVVTAREKSPDDPLAGINAKSYEAIQAVDQAVIGPVAMGYKSGIPKPLRLGLRNFLRNLEEPVIALNYLLQIKPGRAAKTVGRMVINSTMGIGGLVDVAKRPPFNLPYTPNGFANTFACYGIGPGPYFFLPLVGPTTLRDVIGVSLDRAFLPAVVGKPLDRPYYAISANVIDSLNDRVEIDGQLKQIRENSADPYVATRELYLRQRKAEIAAICPKKGEKVEKGLPPRPGKGRD